MVYLLLAFALALVGCSDWYYEAADTDYHKNKTHELRGQYPIDGRTIEGDIIFPAFSKAKFTPEKVLLIQLDSSLAELDTLKGEILKKDSVDYRIPYHAYKYPYVKIQVKGNWKFLSSKGVPLTLETICDISNVWKPNVNLLTHLEVPLVESLVADEYPFNAAKGLASQVFTENFGFEYRKDPVETYKQESSELYPLYRMFLLGSSDSAIVENIEDFRLDLADGIYDGSDNLVQFADYIVEDWLRKDSLVTSLNMSKVQWGISKALVERAYGLTACTDSSVGYFYVKSLNSKFKGDSLVCDKGQFDYYVYRVLDSLERKYGACTFIDTSMNAIVSQEDNSFLYCIHSTMEYTRWSEPSMNYVLNSYLGKCDNKDSEGVRKRFRDTIYVCESNSNYWRKDGTDTLSFYLGKCDTASLWKLNKLQDSSEFVCTFESWVPANDSLRFLSKQRPCERNKDSLRVLTYDSLYYVCAEVKWKESKVYTFKDTTQTDAESIARRYYLKSECATVADTVKYIIDSLENKYYHCEKRENVLAFYESDFDHAQKYLNEQYLKTLPACTAESDTLELFFHPYLAKIRGADWTTNYHCENVGGKYQYKAVDEVRRVILMGLADVNERFTCDLSKDSLYVVQDTVYGNYFHCEERNGRYEFVSITREQAISYASYAAMGKLDACEPSDTIQYQMDDYNYYYYCTEKNGKWEHKRIERDSLALLLVDQLNRKDPCDATVQRWRATTFSLKTSKYFYEVYYMICDYDGQNNFVWNQVSESHYDLVNKMSRAAALDLPACSAEEIAARGPAVEVQNGFITDPRDGHKYSVKTMGKQVWMTENLDYYDTLFMPNLIGKTGCADSSDCTESSRSYTWYGAVNSKVTSNFDELRSQLCTPIQGVCPVGWHIPSMLEWQELFDYAEKNKSGRDYGIGVRNKWNSPYAVSEASTNGEKLNMALGVEIPYDGNSYGYKNYFFYSAYFAVRCVKD